MAEAQQMTHSITIRVYYEDTDLGGIVYYANYLKFIERSRTEWVRACGIDQLALKNDLGLIFVVRRVEADYLRSAVFDDLLTVTTNLVELGGTRIVLDQAVLRGTDVLFKARVVLVCIDQKGPVRLPAPIRAALTALR